jgi:HD superfamily phosphohydrolase
VDIDRMDYLIRDAHHTGIKYGQIDRDYILYHLTTYNTQKKSSQKDGRILAVKENAMHAVEDFLIARFAWYSQVVRNSSSAKFDILASHIAAYLLDEGLIHSFADLMHMVAEPERFFTFNDVYFMGRVQELYLSGAIKNPSVREQMKMLIYRIPPRTVRMDESIHRLVEIEKDGSLRSRDHAIKKLESKIQEIEHLFKTKGNGTEWILTDIPHKDVVFTRALQSLTGSNAKTNAYYERDSVKIIDRNNVPRLLVEFENSLLSKLSSFVNFIPNVYCNEAALKFLTDRKIVK